MYVVDGKTLGYAIIRRGEFHGLTVAYPIVDKMTLGVPFKLDSVCEVVWGAVAWALNSQISSAE